MPLNIAALMQKTFLIVICWWYLQRHLQGCCFFRKTWQIIDKSLYKSCGKKWSNLSTNKYQKEVFDFPFDCLKDLALLSVLFSGKKPSKFLLFKQVPVWNVRSFWSSIWLIKSFGITKLSFCWEKAIKLCKLWCATIVRN